MKTILCLLISLSVYGNIYAQQSGIDSTGLPGDNFSLQGALEYFKKATSPEEFEKLINQEGNHVNNLDLNSDGEIDYVRVIDKMDHDLHAIILQVIISESENQDIAVIEIEKTGAEEATLQLIGDEDIYGEEVIMEPYNGENEEDQEAIEQFKSGKGPNSYYRNSSSGVAGIYINVWAWPSVRFVYAPVYHPWVSPWKWSVYPAWWRPWRPVRWNVWHPRVIAYHRPFTIVSTHRVVRAHAIYRPARVTSMSVRTKHAGAVNNYKVTKTKTKVVGPRGGVHTKTTTTVKKNGKVKSSRTKMGKRH